MLVNAVQLGNLYLVHFNNKKNVGTTGKEVSTRKFLIKKSVRLRKFIEKITSYFIPTQKIWGSYFRVKKCVIAGTS